MTAPHLLSVSPKAVCAFVCGGVVRCFTMLLPESGITRSPGPRLRCRGPVESPWLVDEMHRHGQPQLAAVANAASPRTPSFFSC